MEPAVWLGIGTLLTSGIGLIISIISQYRLNNLQSKLKREFTLEMIYQPLVIEDLKNFREWSKTGYKLVSEYKYLKISTYDKYKDVKSNTASLFDTTETLPSLNDKVEDVTFRYALWMRDTAYYSILCHSWNKEDLALRINLMDFSNSVGDIFSTPHNYASDLPSQELGKLTKSLESQFLRQISSIDYLIKTQLEINTK